MATSRAPRPAFIFSYNAHDEDVAALISSSTPSTSTSTSRQAYAGLGIADSHARARQEAAREDDWVPTYGPTTHRKGKMRFVPARDPQFQTLPGRQEVPFDNDDERAQPQPAPKQRAPAGTDVRNLYASIVGLDNKSPPTAPGITQSEPASCRTSPPPPSPPTAQATSATAEEARSPSRKKRPRTASPPPRPVPFEPARGRAVPIIPAREPDMVLSSDSEEEIDASVGTPGGGSSTKNSRRGRPGSGSSSGDDDDDDGSADEDDDDDDDLVVIDPLTGLAEERRDPLQNTALRKRVQPLFIHQLLPRASSSSLDSAATGAGRGPLKPFVPPTQYAIKPDSPGWRLLARQGWREGLPLGPVPAVVSGAAFSNHGDAQDGACSGDAAATTAGRLKVPLRAVEKHDRSGIGVARAPQDRVVVGALNSEQARRAREERERERRRAEQEARQRRGKGERGMERQRKKEERERKAWIAYMNR